MVLRIARHLFRTGLAAWALVSVVFLLIHRDLGAVQLTSPDASEQRGSGAPLSATAQSATEQAIDQRLGLNEPLFYVSPPAGPRGSWRWNGLHNQYHRWTAHLLHGDLGQSFRTGRAASAELADALAFTLPLTGLAVALSVGCALLLALGLAGRPWWHRPVRAALVGLQALPLFGVGLVLLLAFANPEALDWFPGYGLGQTTDQPPGTWGYLAAYLWHLVLPTTALVLSALPELTLQLHASLLQELGSHYVVTARAKGLAEPVVIRRHALRNALLPSLAQLAELLPALVAGAVVVEVVFALPGMGRLLAGAAAARDAPVLVGGVLLVGAARMLALLATDVLNFWIDPRIRWQS
ncbi:ABC transporter permease [Hymenobacter sp. BT523]|uniref:ABC transporter permease subunit n=1 Tax=Hymenobacter sp. BT523 TaxID=2795725 RepID=UPI0018EC4B1B|nr:ABC transporter permease [Hymenobacter sp. BT523]MBJ6109019.1 ABC transporter permease [Hymenobacter sp. BT523]